MDDRQQAKLAYGLAVHYENYQVFCGNSYELKRAVDSFTVEMWNSEGPLRLQREVARLLHNWLASAISLIDAYRFFLSAHVLPNELTKQYHARIKKDFAESEMHNFVKDLRNYTLHRNLPPLVGNHRRTEHNEEIHESCSIGLNRTTLLAWDEWSPRSKTFLSKQDSFFDLRPLLATYGDAVAGLHKWFSEEVIKLAPRGKDLILIANEPEEVWAELRELEKELGQKKGDGK